MKKLTFFFALSVTFSALATEAPAQSADEKNMQKKLRHAVHADAVLDLSQRSASRSVNIETNTLAHRALPGKKG